MLSDSIMEIAARVITAFGMSFLLERVCAVNSESVEKKITLKLNQKEILMLH